MNISPVFTLFVMPGEPQAKRPKCKTPGELYWCKAETQTSTRLQSDLITKEKQANTKSRQEKVKTGSVRYPLVEA